MIKFLIVRFLNLDDVVLIIVQLLRVYSFERSHKGTFLGGLSALELIALASIELLAAFKKKHEKY